MICVEKRVHLGETLWLEKTHVKVKFPDLRADLVSDTAEKTENSSPTSKDAQGARTPVPNATSRPSKESVPEFGNVRNAALSLPAAHSFRRQALPNLSKTQ